MNRGPCSVYVIGCHERGVVKIGIAMNVGRRLAQLQHASATYLAIYHARNFTTREIAAQVEARTHDLLKSARLRGEWFGASRADAEAAIDAAAVWVRNRRISIPDLADRRFVHLRGRRA